MSRQTRSPAPPERRAAPHTPETPDPVPAARAGDPRAQAALFEAFYGRLRRLAVHRLGSLGPLADPSLIAASALKSLFEKFDPAHPKHDRVDHVTEVGKAWAFVFTAAVQRVEEARRAARAQKRGAAETVSASALPVGGAAAADTLDRQPLGPEAVAELVDICERMFVTLTPRERHILELRLAGHTMQEIADSLNVAKRTAEYSLEQARKKLAAFHPDLLP